ncbi:hypothetical protein Dcar01_02549 [Deinococcus carri]|uniref:Uncharacterized protein n=1 Tax=Deinococcus carri TaxID=1211323 RepID=A0ABP9W9W2_9DEIO
MTLALFLLYALCVLLAGSPLLPLAQLATLCGPLLGLVALARAFRPRPAPEVQP